MSAGSALATKTKKRVSYTGLFDWAADHLRLATPRNVVSALMDSDVNCYVECIDEYVPRAEQNTLRAFRRLTDTERMTEAKKWFENIEPGRMAFRDPPW